MFIHEHVPKAHLLIRIYQQVLKVTVSVRSATAAT